MEFHRLGVKFFAKDPVSIPLADFIPVFHEWIQKQRMPDHLLIDLHDYSHIHNGPGILLVAHEGNFSMDSGGGRLGLFYYRKQPVNGAAPVLKAAQQACSLLESERAMGGRLRFRADELLIVANDRLNAPNDDDTFARLKPELAGALESVFGKSAALERVANDPRERLTICARLGKMGS